MNGIEVGLGIEYLIFEENMEGNGVICSKGIKYESSVNVLCGFKMEKLKMFCFVGDVRDYVIFWFDFKYVVDSRYSKRDVIFLFCISL